MPRVYWERRTYEAVLDKQKTSGRRKQPDEVRLETTTVLIDPESDVYCEKHADFS